jgi:hypothetical protein
MPRARIRDTNPLIRDGLHDAEVMLDAGRPLLCRQAYWPCDDSVCRRADLSISPEILE